MFCFLNFRIHQTEINENDIGNSMNNRRDIDQLREMMDEKDRHINDLTETLNHFHVSYCTFITNLKLNFRRF